MLLSTGPSLSTARISDTFQTGEIKVKSFLIKAGIPVCALAFSSAAFAQQLTAEEIKNISIGNTVEVTAYVPRSTKFKNYFEADGNAQSLEENGKENKGKWRITEDGLHCTQWGKREESCVQVIKTPDGNYNRVDSSGTVRATWTKITPGKNF